MWETRLRPYERNCSLMMSLGKAIVYSYQVDDPQLKVCSRESFLSLNINICCLLYHCLPACVLSHWVLTFLMNG